MIVGHQFFLLIYILCYAAAIHGILLDANDAETCNLLCIQCNASAVFANDHCECNFADDSEKVSGAECIQRIERDIQAIELNMFSEDLTEEERNVRSILKYRRRLRPGDAEKVAQYFINGGPAAGHSHFSRVFDAARDSADSTTNSFSGVVDESNPEDGFHDVSLTSPVSWNTCNSPLYMVSESVSYTSPAMQGVKLYPQIRLQNPAITYSARRMYDPTSSSTDHPHGSPHALFRAVTFPAHVLHHILHPRVYHHPVHHHPVYHHPMYHRGIVRNTNFPQDGSETPITDQSRENNGGSTTSNFPTAESNLDKLVEQNINGLTDPSQYPEAYITHALYQPMQYQTFPRQYTSYYSPLINVLYPNGYIFQPASSHAQDISDPLTFASNPYFCKNANTEQRSEILTADKPIPFNDDISDNPTRNDIPKEEKEPE